LAKLKRLLIPLQVAKTAGKNACAAHVLLMMDERMRVPSGGFGDTAYQVSKLSVIRATPRDHQKELEPLRGLTTLTFEIQQASQRPEQDV